MMKITMPRFYCWDGGALPDKWSFGYLTGIDNDLVCIYHRMFDKIGAEMALSPVCANRFLAISAFVLKRILLRLDDNVGVRRSPCGSPNKE